MKKLRVLSVLFQKFKMRSLLDDMPIINYQDPIGKCCIGKSMGNGNRALALAQMIQLLKYSVFRDRIKRGRRFVKDHIFTIFEICTCKPHKLPLTAGEVFPIVGVIPSENAVKSVFPIFDNLARTADITSPF